MMYFILSRRVFRPRGRPARSSSSSSSSSSSRGRDGTGAATDARILGAGRLLDADDAAASIGVRRAEEECRRFEAVRWLSHRPRSGSKPKLEVGLTRRAHSLIRDLRARASEEKASGSACVAMDVLFAFTGDKFAVVVSDTTSVQQIIVQKDDEEKTLDLDSHKLLAMSGPKGDCVHFGEYVQANMKLYELKNGHKLSTHAAMSFIRGELAAALRKGPYQVNMLLAGCARASVRRLRFLRRVRIVRSSSLARSLPIPSVVVRARASRRASPRGAVVLLRRASIAPRRGPPRDPVPPPTMTNLISLLPQSLSPSSDRYDEHEDDASLYFIDYLASTQKVNSGGHGYGGMFCLSLFDKHWKPKMTRAEADALVDMCIAEVRERLVTAPAKYHVKIVDKTGTSCTLYDCVEKAAEKARMAA